MADRPGVFFPSTLPPIPRLCFCVSFSSLFVPSPLLLGLVVSAEIIVFFFFFFPIIEIFFFSVGTDTRFPFFEILPVDVPGSVGMRCLDRDPIFFVL